MKNWTGENQYKVERENNSLHYQTFKANSEGVKGNEVAFLKMRNKNSESKSNKEY